MRVLTLALVAVAIAALTLRPLDAVGPPVTWCLTCGPLISVDFVANVLLFVPFGVVAYSLKSRLLWAVAAGAVFSGIIEALQWLLITGRHAGIPDLLANTVGAAMGASLALASGRILRPSRSAAAVQWKALALFTLLLSVASAWLLAPAPPAYTYWSQWTPSRTGYSTFEGTLESLQLFGEEIPNGTPIDPTTRPSAYVLGELTISGRVVAGPSNSRRAIIARAGNPLGEHFQLAQHRQALIFRPRVNAARVGFRSPSLDLGNVMVPGAREFELSLDHRRARLRMEGAEDRTVGITVGYIWQVISPFETWSGTHHALVAGTLFALLFALLAYYEGRAYRTSQVFGSLAVGAVSLVAIPLVAQMPIDGWGELLGWLLGIAAGAVLARHAGG